MDLDRVRAWQRILRDLVLVAIGVFLLIHEAYAKVPSPYLIGAGLAALGLAPALRLDRGKEEEHEVEQR